MNVGSVGLNRAHLFSGERIGRVQIIRVIFAQWLHLQMKAGYFPRIGLYFAEKPRIFLLSSLLEKAETVINTHQAVPQLARVDGS